MLFNAFSNRNCGRCIRAGAKLWFRNDWEFRSWKQQVYCIEHTNKKKGEAEYLEAESRDQVVLFLLLKFQSM